MITKYSQKVKGSKNNKNARTGGWGKRFYRFNNFLYFGFAVRSLKKFKANSEPKSPLPPFRLLGTPKPKIFFSFLKKTGARKI